MLGWKEKRKSKYEKAPDPSEAFLTSIPKPVHYEKKLRQIAIMVFNNQNPSLSVWP